MEFFICFVFFVFCLAIFLLGYNNKKKENKKEIKSDFMSIKEAIDRVTSEVPGSNRVQITNQLPEKYHYQYWINCFNEDFLFKYTKFNEDFGYYPTIKEINKKTGSIDWFSINIKDVEEFIKKIKKEEEQWKLIDIQKEFREEPKNSVPIIDANEYGSNKDDGKTVDVELVVD